MDKEHLEEQEIYVIPEIGVTQLEQDKVKTNTQFSFNGSVWDITPFTLATALRWTKSGSLNLLRLVDMDNLQNLLITVDCNDEFMLDTLHKAFPEMTEEEFINAVDDEDFRLFKKAFWETIVNFSNPQIQPMLTQAAKSIRKALKEKGAEMVEQGLSRDLQSLDSKSGSSNSESNQE